MRITFTIILSFAFHFIFCQSHSYSFQLDSIEDPAEAKDASGDLFHIFDITPSFDDESDLFVVRSVSDLTEDTFQAKCAEKGYTLTYFKKDETGIVITEGD